MASIDFSAAGEEISAGLAVVGQSSGLAVALGDAATATSAYEIEGAHPAKSNASADIDLLTRINFLPKHCCERSHMRCKKASENQTVSIVFGFT
jgi:hypothetical protein